MTAPIISGTAIPLEDGNVKTAAQDQTTPPVQYYLMREDKTDIILASPVNVGDTVFSLASGPSGHGFTAGGEYLSIMQDGAFLQTKVKSVSGNDITLSEPATTPFTLDATIIRGSVEMNINGSVTPNNFQFYLRDAVVPIDIETAVITMWHTATGDDSHFGDLNALTNGLLFQRSDGTIQNYGLYRSNSDFVELGSKLTYTDKAGGGLFATQIFFDIKDIYGVALRLNPKTADKFIGTVQDDLTGLARMRVSLMGQYTIGEEV
jgi:hypothetical protein